MSNLFKDRESQIALAGGVVAMEGILKNGYVTDTINQSDLEKKIKKMREQITDKTIIKCMEESEKDV